MSQVDWQLLEETAIAAMKSAYAPYSKFPVGVAALVDDGRIISGCNVENASYGLTLCAECGLVSNLILSGGGRLVAFLCVDLNKNYLMPCGRCRQLLQEHGGSQLQLMTDTGVKPLSELLPWAFGPDEMDKRLD
jgi:cytidine deaminase